jgi:hypothetical protein
MEKLLKNEQTTLFNTSSKKEVVVNYKGKLYKLKSFARIKPTKEDMDWMFENYHPMLLTEGGENFI